MEMLHICDLHKRFGDQEVLRGVQLSVPENSIYGFIGKNGSGKTTTMKLVLGLLKADAGEITVNGERVVYGQTATNRYIGYLPDVPEFYSFMTPMEYLRLCGEVLGLSGRDLLVRAEELLSMVGLSNEKHRIKGFSRGMKQRLGIAQALLARPRLLICDEPTSALDPVGRRELLDVLRSVRQETTVLFSTHILSDMEQICTDIALLHEGKIALQGTVGEIKQCRGKATGFLVELADPAETAELLQHFLSARRDGEGQVLFPGGESEMIRVLSFLCDHGYALRRIERLEPTLEDLFLEVVGK